MAREEKATLYGWAFRTGGEILKKLEAMYGRNGAEKRMRTILLNLRAEALPDKFRREFVNVITEIEPEVSFREEFRGERAWRIDEFYRYSGAIIAGLYDALQAWKRSSERKESK